MRKKYKFYFWLKIHFNAGFFFKFDFLGRRQFMFNLGKYFYIFKNVVNKKVNGISKVF